MRVAQAARRSMVCRCSSRRPSGNLNGGRGSRHPRASCARPWTANPTLCRCPDAMHVTTFDEFRELAQRGTFVPVYKEIVADLLTPVSAFLKIAEHSHHAFLLESVEG